MGGKLNRQASNITKLGIMCIVGVLALSFAPGAMAQCGVTDTREQGTITFPSVTTQGAFQSPTSGSFLYDESDSTFITFDVLYNGTDYAKGIWNNLDSVGALVLGLPAGGTDVGTWTIVDIFQTIDQMTDQMTLSNAGGSLETVGFGGGISCTPFCAHSAGDYSVQVTATISPSTSVPEPGALMILFANLAAVALLARKRIAPGYRQYMRTTCEPPPSH